MEKVPLPACCLIIILEAENSGAQKIPDRPEITKLPYAFSGDVQLLKASVKMP
jgi:hypothetical protein